MNYYYPNQYDPMSLSMQEAFAGPPKTAGSRTPGIPYMILPMMPEVLEEERLAFEDARRLQSFYPETAQMIQRVVEEECDKMEYEGSMMFDEYPDRVMLWKLSGDILVRVWDAMEISGDPDIQFSVPEQNRTPGAMDRAEQNQTPGATDRAEQNRTSEALDRAEQNRASGAMDQAEQNRTLEAMGRPGGPDFGPGAPGRPDFGPRGPHRPPRERPDRNHLRDFVQVLLLDEMHRRRCRHRRCRRFW